MNIRRVKPESQSRLGEPLGSRLPSSNPESTLHIPLALRLTY
jgi:hypothetical protein